ncbi:TPA: hypothetical protein ACGGM7_000314 [Escherichia coli]
MGWENLAAIIIAAIGFIWTVHRDKSSDNEDLYERISSLETKVDSHSTEILKLEAELGRLENNISKLQSQIHKMDLKIERILTILEDKQKGR